MENVCKHPLYHTWREMRRRCNNPKAKDEKYYKNKTVSKEWNDFETFVNDIGPRPTPAHSIDRIDNSLGYSKENCRWATAKEQVANRTYCINGHKWTDKNTIIIKKPSGKGRLCRTCFNRRAKRKVST